MNNLKGKSISVALLTSSLLMGCASTDPYTPQSDEDFVYDNDMSFALNVIEGSLGFSGDLRDTKRRKNTDNTPSALDYAADGIIGAAFGGGLGGAFLSMLGTSQSSDAPFDSQYGIVYFPVAKKGNVQAVFDTIEQELIDAAESKRELIFVGESPNDRGKILLTFKGKDCDTENVSWDFPLEDTCNFIHYLPPQLLRYSTVNPRGEEGLYAVVGYEKFYTGTYLSFDIDDKYYTFYPASAYRTKFPFVVNDNEIFLFIRPDNNTSTKDSLTTKQLMNIDPWVNKHYGAVQ